MSTALETFQTSPHLIEEAASWLAECFPHEDYSSSREDWASISTESLGARIERHYDGGLAAFTLLS